MESKLTPESIALTFLNYPDGNITKIKGRPDYCDENIPKKYIRSDLSFINNLRWTEIEGKHCWYAKHAFRSTTYLSTKKSEEIKLMAISCTYKDLPNDAFFLVLIEPNYFIIVGVVGEHPMIESSTFTYVNSDGSGPKLFNEMNDPRKLAESLIKFYDDFSENRYH